jgi:hypothetical protein
MAEQFRFGLRIWMRSRAPNIGFSRQTLSEAAVFFIGVRGGQFVFQQSEVRVAGFTRSSG